MSYRSKVDLWLVLLLAAAAIFSLVSLVPTLGLVLAFLLELLVAAVLLMLLWPCEYRLEPDRLNIRSGLLNWRIRYPEILSAEPSFDLTAAPALSVQRVKIRTTGRTFLVSPVDRDGFIDALMQRVNRVR
ncbi:PH domain-containing protein [Saccharospirillum mangrovi]|uniref:PH domain-containing protein n=1 Tax=Saccharospirillum mangrovi TaxID=2161747 RepID=UPI000D39DB11|nr:PH domain-containing protein [Saccharospirillum mangrovi]